MQTCAASRGSPVGGRAADPARREGQRGAGIDGPGRHPHDEAGELLVLERRQTPIECVLRSAPCRAPAAPAPSRRRARWCGASSRTGARRRRPAWLRRSIAHQNSRAVTKKLRCCSRCRTTLVDRRVEQRGTCQTQIAMPCSVVAVTGRVSAFQPVRHGAALRQAGESQPRGPRQRPQQRAERPGQHEQRRRDRHDDLVLDHVEREEMLAQPMQAARPGRRRAPASRPHNRHAPSRDGAGPSAAPDAPPPRRRRLPKSTAARGSRDRTSTAVRPPCGWPSCASGRRRQQRDEAGRAS